MTAPALLGVVLPVTRGSQGYFAQTTDIPTQVKSNLTNLLLTNLGERIMLPLFGCDLSRYIFQPMTADNLANVKGTVASAIQRWMPFVTIVDLNVQQDQDFHKVFLTLQYSIQITPQSFDAVTVSFTQ